MGCGTRDSALAHPRSLGHRLGRQSCSGESLGSPMDAVEHDRVRATGSIDEANLPAPDQALRQLGKLHVVSHVVALGKRHWHRRHRYHVMARMERGVARGERIRRLGTLGHTRGGHSFGGESLGSPMDAVWQVHLRPARAGGPSQLSSEGFTHDKVPLLACSAGPAERLATPWHTCGRHSRSGESLGHPMGLVHTTMWNTAVCAR